MEPYRHSRVGGPFIGTRTMKNFVLQRCKRTRWHSVIRDSSIHRGDVSWPSYWLQSSIHRAGNSHGCATHIIADLTHNIEELDTTVPFDIHASIEIYEHVPHTHVNYSVPPTLNRVDHIRPC